MVASRTETYLVSNIGPCLLLKLCGFIQEQRAEIHDVGDHRLLLRIGSTWLSRLTGSKSPGHPIDLEIRFNSLEESNHTTHPQARVDILIRDRQFFFHADQFESATQQILWQLRGHLMVNSSELVPSCPSSPPILETNLDI